MSIYKFKKYEKIFPVLYDNERKRISKILSKKCLVEHIGSTAVCKLGGKGVIDIMISCPKNEITKVKNKLIDMGYEQKYSSEKNRIFLRRETKIKGKQRRFHAHITPLNHIIWKRAISFKNYLAKHPKIARKYAELKKKAIIKCNNDGKVYIKLKSKFIKHHTKKSMKNLD